MRDGSDLPPYIAEVARLDWALGILSVATDHEAIGIDALALPRAERDANICKLICDGIESAADMSDFPRAEPAQFLAGGIVEGN